MTPPRAIDSCGAVFGLVHARTIVSHARSRYSPSENFQEEDAYMPGRDISGDIRRMVAHYAHA
jgi:hypothetical protein